VNQARSSTYPACPVAIHVDDAALLRDLEESLSEVRIGTITDHSDAIFVGTIDDGEGQSRIITQAERDCLADSSPSAGRHRRRRIHDGGR
jgi:hypothetical protein